jgi:hypothetical protein
VLGSYQTVELIETFVNYHENIKKCVCIVYDPHRSARGTLGLKAIRLRESFIEKFKEQKVGAGPPLQLRTHAAGAVLRPRLPAHAGLGLSTRAP